MKIFKKAKKGFTLVELVVVIAVIAILAAVSVGAYFGVTESAKNSKAEQEAKSLHTSIMLVVNEPNSGYTLDKTGKITFGTDKTFDTFLTAVEAMSGLDLGEATKNGETYTVAGNVADDKPVGYIVEFASGSATVDYVSTDLVKKTITVKTGAIA